MPFKNCVSLYRTPLTYNTVHQLHFNKKIFKNGRKKTKEKLKENSYLYFKSPVFILIYMYP